MTDKETTIYKVRGEFPATVTQTATKQLLALFIAVTAQVLGTIVLKALGWG